MKKKKKVPDANFGCLVRKGRSPAVLPEQLLAEHALSQCVAPRLLQEMPTSMFHGTPDYPAKGLAAFVLWLSKLIESLRAGDITALVSSPFFSVFTEEQVLLIE